MAFFELTDQSQVATAWFLAYEGGDLMAIVFRDTAEAPWKMVIRERMQVDDEEDPDLSNDEKKGFEVHRGPDEGSRDDLVVRTDVVFDAFKLAHPQHRFWREEINGSAEDFAHRWSQLPFAHAKVPVEGPRDPQ